MKAHAWETLSLGVWGHCGELWRQVGQSALWRDPSMEMLRVYGGGAEPRGQWMDMVCRVRWWLCRALRGTKVFPCNSEYPFSCYTGFWWQLNNDTQQRHIRPFYLFWPHPSSWWDKAEMGESRSRRKGRRGNSRLWLAGLRVTLDKGEQKHLSSCRLEV